MLEDSEIAELRSLHARAYGRDGGLTRAESARLADLEARRRRSTRQTTAPSTDTAEDYADDERVAPADTDEEPQADAPTDAGVASDESASGEDPPVPVGDVSAPRSRVLLVGAALALVLVGIGAGWALSEGFLTRTVASFAHADVRASLEAERDYDPGSLSVIGEKGDVLVWRATTSAGAEDCVVLTAGEDQSPPSCAPGEHIAENPGTIWASLTRTGSEGSSEQVSGTILRAVDGTWVGIVQIWGTQSDVGWRAMYDAEEIEVLEHAEAQGVDPAMVNVIGADGEALIWVSRSDAVEVCLMVGTPSALTEACAPSDAENLTVMAPDDSGVLTEYRMTATPRGDLLTILKPASTADTNSPDVLPPPVNDEIDVEFDDFSQGSSDDAG